MAVLTIRKSAWTALSARDSTLVTGFGAVLSLGVGAEYKDGGVAWLIFSDWRFKADDVAYLGCLIANLSGRGNYRIPEIVDEDDNVIGIDRGKMRSDNVAWVKDSARQNLYVAPADIAHADGGNPWQDILDAQGTPTTVQMDSAVPASWLAVSA